METIEIIEKKIVCKPCHEVGGYTCAPHKCWNRLFSDPLPQPNNK